MLLQRLAWYEEAVRYEGRGACMRTDTGAPAMQFLLSACYYPYDYIRQHTFKKFERMPSPLPLHQSALYIGISDIISHTHTHTHTHTHVNSDIVSCITTPGRLHHHAYTGTGIPPTDERLGDFYHNCKNSILQQMETKLLEIADALFRILQC